MKGLIKTKFLLKLNSMKKFFLSITIVLIGYFSILIFLKKIIFEPLDKKHIKAHEEVENKSEFDPVLYDQRFRFIDDTDIRKAIFIYGKELALYINDPYGFLIALICVESNFGKKLYGLHGERGVMQIHPYWFDVYKVEPEFFDNHFNNVKFAVDLLKGYFRKYGDPFVVLQLWNTGSLKKKNKKFINRFIDCYLNIGLGSGGNFNGKTTKTAK